MSVGSERRRRVAEAAAHFDGALSRALMGELGADRHVIAREVAAERWQEHGQRTIATHTGPLSDRALRWRAVWEVGCDAAVDGVSALQVAGLQGYDEPLVHISVPHERRPGKVDGVQIHRVNRDPAEVLTNGLPRTRPAVAAVRAAGWAASDRQAALLLAMPVQQRLVSGPMLTLAAHTVGRRRRRALIPQLVFDVVGGAQSLGELDLVALCRRTAFRFPIGKWSSPRQVAASTSTPAGFHTVSPSRSTGQLIAPD